MAPPKRPGSRLLVGRIEAAEMLGMSVDHFDKYVRPNLPAIPLGRRLLFRVDRLAEWAERSEVRIY